MSKEVIKKEFYNVVPDILKKAGSLALDLRKQLKINYKSNTGRENSDIVTNADEGVQEIILKSLLKTKLKECKVFCEEDTKSVNLFPKDTDFLISIDPIDGTLAYAKSNSDHWQIIVQLKTQYKFLVTMIYYPVSDSLLIIDDTIRLNDKKIEEYSNKEESVVWDELPGPSQKAIDFAKKKKWNLKRREKASESGFIIYAKKKFLGMHRLRLNAVDSLVWAHITQALGGKSIEIFSSRIIGQDFDFFDVDGRGYYKGEYFAIIE